MTPALPLMGFRSPCFNVGNGLKSGRSLTKVGDRIQQIQNLLQPPRESGEGGGCAE